MKNSQTFEDREISDSVLSSMEELIQAHINELIEKYNTQLIKNGKRLDSGDIVKLRKAIRGDKLKIKMTFSSSITQKLMDDWDIYPTSLRQSTFDNIESMTFESSGGKVTLTSDDAKHIRELAGDDTE